MEHGDPGANSGPRPGVFHTAKIRPNPFLFWTPRWRDLRTDHTTWDGDVFGDAIDVVADILHDVLWNRFLWVICAAIIWVLEVCAAVVLAPVALLTSVLGVPRHRLVAGSEAGAEQHVLNRGSWYAMRRARAQARAQLAR